MEKTAQSKANGKRLRDPWKIEVLPVNAHEDLEQELWTVLYWGLAAWTVVGLGEESVEVFD